MVDKPEGPFYVDTLEGDDYLRLYCVRIRNEQVESWETPFISWHFTLEADAQDLCDRLNRAVREWAGSHPIRRMVLFAESVPE